MSFPRGGVLGTIMLADTRSQVGGHRRQAMTRPHEASQLLMTETALTAPTFGVTGCWPDMQSRSSCGVDPCTGDHREPLHCHTGVFKPHRDSSSGGLAQASKETHTCTSASDWMAPSEQRTRVCCCQAVRMFVRTFTQTVIASPPRGRHGLREHQGTATEMTVEAPFCCGWDGWWGRRLSSDTLVRSQSSDQSLTWVMPLNSLKVSPT